MAGLGSQGKLVGTPKMTTAAPLTALAIFKSHMKSSNALGPYARPNSVPMHRGIDAYSPKHVRLAPFGGVTEVEVQTR